MCMSVHFVATSFLKKELMANAQLHNLCILRTEIRQQGYTQNGIWENEEFVLLYNGEAIAKIIGDKLYFHFPTQQLRDTKILSLLRTILKFNNAKTTSKVFQKHYTWYMEKDGSLYRTDSGNLWIHIDTYHGELNV